MLNKKDANREKSWLAFFWVVVFYNTTIFFDLAAPKLFSPRRHDGHDVFSASRLIIIIQIEHKMGYLYRDLSNKIYDSIFEVHRTLGPGLLESTYEICLKKELEDAGLIVEQQKLLPVVYKGVLLD